VLFRTVWIKFDDLIQRDRGAFTQVTTSKENFAISVGKSGFESTPKLAHIKTSYREDIKIATSIDWSITSFRFEEMP